MLQNIKIWLDNHTKWVKALAFTYFLILNWLLLKPNGELIKINLFKINLIDIDLSLLFNDKVLHTIAFFILSVFSQLLFPKIKKIALLVLITFYGLLIEILQFGMHLGRSFDLYDLLFDFIGASLAVLFLSLLFPSKQ